MSSSVRRSDRRHRPTARDLMAAGYVLSMIVIAAVAAWPIYRSTRFVVLVVVATVVGGALAGVARRWRWPAWLTATAAFGAFVVLGVPLAVPSQSSLGGLPQGLVEVMTGAVLGWKDLVTVELPVGSYRNLLVPALIVFLVGTTSALLLSWRRGPSAGLGVPVALAMVFFGLLFGRPVTSSPLVLGPVTIPAPVELATGAAGLVASVLWLTWCTYDDRARALRRAAATSGVRMSRRRSASDGRRMALGVAMVVAPVAVASLLAPTIAQGTEREVLRSAIGPDLALSSAVSPLAEYRSNFDDDRFAEVLFRVDPVDGEPLPARIRLATLDYYDGEVFRAIDPASSVVDTRFVRVPSTLPSGEGDPVAARIVIEGLAGIWMPTAGSLSTVDFDGERAAPLADGFYYNDATDAGIEVSGFEPGDAFVLRANEDPATDLSTATAPGVTGGIEAPDALATWVARHVDGDGGAALAGLVDLLRERGYLSHALAVVDGSTPAWMQPLDGYAFRASVSGHSVARVDALFQSLLTREQEAAPGDSLVAAVGDEEQFAAAVALIARELGFPSRVVVGARVEPAEGQRSCLGGICRAGDLTAWTEVQSAEGDWIPVEVTPQYAEALDTDTTQRRDPQNETEVRPDTAEAVDPPDPVQQDAAPDETTPDDGGLDLGVLWGVLRIAGLALLALLVVSGPLLVIVLAKALRRRARRNRDAPDSRIAGGWDEYLDAAVDSGRQPPRTQTRAELAALYGTPRGAVLADRADAAVFGERSTTDDEAEAFWHIVDDERSALRADRGIWQRLGSALSLRSFTRSLGASPRRAAARTIERRTRRPGGDARST